MLNYVQFVLQINNPQNGNLHMRTQFTPIQLEEFYEACQTGNKSRIKELIYIGNQYTDKIVINEFTQENFKTALKRIFEATNLDKPSVDIDLFKTLLGKAAEQSSQQSLRVSINYKFCFKLAIDHNQINIITYLLSLPMEPEWDSSFLFNYTCERHSRIDILKKLLLNTIDPSDNDNAALATACIKENVGAVDFLLNDERVKPNVCFFDKIIEYYNDKNVYLSNTNRFVILEKLNNKINLTNDDYIRCIKLTCQAVKPEPAVLEFLLNQIVELAIETSTIFPQYQNDLIEIMSQAIETKIVDINYPCYSRDSFIVLVTLYHIKTLSDAKLIDIDEILPPASRMKALRHTVWLYAPFLTKLKGIENFYSMITWLCALINFDQLTQEEAKKFFSRYLVNKNTNKDGGIDQYHIEVINYFLNEYGRFITEKTLCTALCIAQINENTEAIKIFESKVKTFQAAIVNQQIVEFIQEENNDNSQLATDDMAMYMEDFYSHRLINLLNLIDKDLLIQQYPKFINKLLVEACENNGITLAKHLCSNFNADLSYKKYLPFHSFFRFYLNNKNIQDFNEKLFNEALIGFLKDKSTNGRDLLNSILEMRLRFNMSSNDISEILNIILTGSIQIELMDRNLEKYKLLRKFCFWDTQPTAAPAQEQTLSFPPSPASLQEENLSETITTTTIIEQSSDIPRGTKREREEMDEEMESGRENEDKNVSDSQDSKRPRI